MTTQTTLSAACPPRPARGGGRAAVVERGTSAPESGSLSFPASLQKPWLPWPARRGGRLIANARLESPATVRKQSVGTRPNRKWIAFFRFAPLATHHSSLVAQMSREDSPRRTTYHLPLVTALPWPPWPARRGGRLIANARLEFPATIRKQSIGTTSNRKWIAIFQFTPQFSRSTLATCHLPLATAIQIYGAAIRTPRKPLKT
jgi:phage terminase large subunit-like protein